MADDECGVFVVGEQAVLEVGGVHRGVVAVGVGLELLEPGAGSAEPAEGDGVAPGLAGEVAAEAEHVRLGALPSGPHDAARAVRAPSRRRVCTDDDVGGPLGDEAFVEFYRRHRHAIFRAAAHRLEVLQDAEDVTAEVFRIAWAHHQRGNALTLPWVYITLRNVVGNAYQREARSRKLAERLCQEVEIRLTADRRLLHVVQHMRELPVADREVLFMAYWEDLPSSRIGEVLGCSAGAVRVRLLRPRNRLMALLEERDRGVRWATMRDCSGGLSVPGENVPEPRPARGEFRVPGV